ncbi:MAG: citryl-CoA lyase [Pseudomonadales bacterium]|nr:citryl-CoA lyase [Candidatus Woesebacteria bacterium]MCB9801269.1 citryl-CoA lyase [Pseudomonadales bacterium]
MSQDLSFTTTISGHTDKDLELRGIPLTELISEANFVSTFFLSLTGRKPNVAEEKVLNALLVAAIDHGINPASGFVPRVVASSGNEMLTCMATSLLALGPYHGGAITGAMKVLQEVNEKGDDKEAAAQWLVKKFRSEKKRVPGFGHPIYKKVDPRSQQLFQLARDVGLSLDYIHIAKAIETTLEEETLKTLVINIDGAMAALLLTMGIAPEAGNAVFGVARVAGSVAHILEEQRSGQWVRRVPAEDVTYSFKKDT